MLEERINFLEKFNQDHFNIFINSQATLLSGSGENWRVIDEKIAPNVVKQKNQYGKI
jgi:hypothetical protein